MKKAFVIVIALAAIAFIGCSSIDVTISRKTDVSKKMKKVAVLPFDVKGAAWGDEFADAITNQFFKTGKIEVAEREAIEKILKEQNLSMTGIVEDNEQATRVGQLLGADVIIIGRGSALQHSMDGKSIQNLIDTFTLKALSVEKGELLFTVRKEPGSAWDWRYRSKFCLSLSLIWDREDVLVDSSRYDDISKQIVKQVLEAIKEIEDMKKAKAK
ncbi:MAG: curli assembly protein CsgG [Spirochaetes bacterium]|nr:MAG: curli assembly protein CsgG [Spirochaetota bacterium]